MMVGARWTGLRFSENADFMGFFMHKYCHVFGLGGRSSSRAWLYNDIGSVGTSFPWSSVLCMCLLYFEHICRSFVLLSDVYYVCSDVYESKDCVIRVCA